MRQALVLKHCCWENMPSFLTIRDETRLKITQSTHYNMNIAEQSFETWWFTWIFGIIIFFQIRGDLGGILFLCSRDRWCKRICEMLLKKNNYPLRGRFWIHHQLIEDSGVVISLSTYDRLAFILMRLFLSLSRLAPVCFQILKLVHRKWYHFFLAIPF